MSSQKATKAWQAVFKAKEQGIELPSDKLNQALSHTAKRDALAYKLPSLNVISSWLETEKLSVDKIKTQQNQHQARLQKIVGLNQQKENLLASLAKCDGGIKGLEARQWRKSWGAFHHQASIVYQSRTLYQKAVEQTGKDLWKIDEKYKALLEKYEIAHDFSAHPHKKSSEVIAKKPHIERHDFKSFSLDAGVITEALLAKPEITYRAIFGEPKKMNGKEMRYEGGLIVSLKGAKAGFWYDFGKSVGGSPIQALMKQRGLSFPDALKEAASIAGMDSIVVSFTKPKEKEFTLSVSLEEKNKILSAKSILKGAAPIAGTLAEKYLKNYRGIEHPEQLKNVYFWPKGASWQATDEQGRLIPKINKIPALLIAGKNEKGDVTAVQRIYLDEKTAAKNTFMDSPKLSKGKIEGSGGILQKGSRNGTVYLAEGPETGASIAMANPNATVIVSFGVFNFQKLDKLIKIFHPQEVIIAGDNDIKSNNNTLKITQEACEALKKVGLNTRIVLPESLSQKDKTDWNDVHKTKGIHEVRRQLGVSQDDKAYAEKLAKDYVLQNQKNDVDLNLLKIDGFKIKDLDILNDKAYRAAYDALRQDQLGNKPIEPQERKQRTMDLEI